VKVDTSGSCWEWIAGRNQQGYGSFGIKGKMHKSHRISYELANGPIPEGMFIDHKCHNPGCVNPAHLRLATPKQNSENRSGAYAATGVRGVSFNRGVRKFEARVTHFGQKHYLGLFTDLAEAESAVVALRNKLYSHNDADRTVA
jgi:hypothetical protein